MAMDTPALIAILGAGPLGLEAALYARFLGYDVEVFERSAIGSEVLRRHGENRLPTAFQECCSSLALRAIQAQDPKIQFPPLDSVLTGNEWVERYLLPLSRTDLLAGQVIEQTEVLEVRIVTLEEQAAITKEPMVEGADEYEEDDSDAIPFLIRSRDASGERTDYANVVVCATGTESRVVLPDHSTAHFHRLGNRDGNAISYREGLAQIRDLFAQIADRKSLNLY